MRVLLNDPPRAQVEGDGPFVPLRVIEEEADIVTLHGNIELGPIVGMTDRIVDITATGTTLAENDLVIVDDVMECSARFFAGPAAYRCDRRIRDLAARLAEVRKGSAS